METKEMDNQKVMDEKKEIEITYSNLTRILLGFNDLSALKITDFKINYNIMKLMKYLSNIEKSYIKTRNSLMSEYIIVEPNGTFKIDGNQMYVYHTKEGREEYTKKINELNDTKVEGVTFTINASLLQKLNPSAQTMVRINEFIIDDIE